MNILVRKPKQLINSRGEKKVIAQFAERLGLVYFGYVDQRDDDHRLVRGVTVSTQHKDNHYCIGSYEGYDITLVRRSDVLTQANKAQKRRHEWLIMTFDIHMQVDLPHLFLGVHSRSDIFYSNLLTKFSQLTRVSLGTLGHYDASFIQKYRLYAAPDQVLSAARIIRPDVATAMAQHFAGIDIEIYDGVIYVYSEHKPSQQMLEKMLQCGLWFVRMIDNPAI